MSEKRIRFSKEARKAVWEKYDGHCAYCGIPLKLEDMQVDHLDPVYTDGSNDFNNLMPSCRSCNNYKRAHTLETFREYLEAIPNTLRRDSVTFKVGERFGMVKQVKEHIKFYFEENENERGHS